jgi:hypothetical protein
MGGMPGMSHTSGTDMDGMDMSGMDMDGMDMSGTAGMEDMTP